MILTDEKRKLLLLFILLSLSGCSDIDACLDNGGSYNYDNCECDYNSKHPYKEEHKC